MSLLTPFLHSDLDEYDKAGECHNSLAAIVDEVLQACLVGHKCLGIVWNHIKNNLFTKKKVVGSRCQVVRLKIVAYSNEGITSGHDQAELNVDEGE
jgi:hypothetical protein